MASNTAAQAGHSPAQNTKIERLAEALETMCLSVAASLSAKEQGKKTSALAKRFAKDAREELRTALRDFLQPALNLIEGGARQQYPADMPEADQITCRACNRHFICADRNCPEWHASLQAKTDAMTHTETEPDNVA